MFLNTTKMPLAGLLNLDVVELASNDSKLIRASNGSSSIGSSNTPVWNGGQPADDDDSSTDRQVVIASAIVILLSIVSICGLLCYREISRRRMEADLVEEYLRKEEIRRTIKKKIAQMQRQDDSDSYREEMKLRVPLVTFGDVTKISPAHSLEALHLEAYHHHYHHHHHHHHHHIHGQQLVVKDNNNKRAVTLPNAGKERHWYANPHKIPTRGRLLTYLFGGNNTKSKPEKQNESKDLEMALKVYSPQ